MTLPPFDNTKHDIGINAVGFMGSAQGDGQIVRQDMGPATSQSALGESASATYETESFFAPTDWQGGVGQYRQVSVDQGLDELGDSTHAGIWYPARVKIPTGAGNADRFVWNVVNSVYAFQGSTIYDLATGTSYAAGGTPASKPVVSGNLYTHYTTTTGHVMRWSAAGGAAVDITPSWFYAWCVARHGELLYCFGKSTESLTIQQRPGYHADYASDSAQLTHEIAWPKKTLPGDTLTMDVIVGAGTEPLPPVIDNTNVVLPQQAVLAPRVVVPPGWRRVGQSSNGTDVTVFSFVMVDAPARSGAEWVELSLPAHAVIFLDAYQGIRRVDALDKLAKQGTGTGAAVASGTTAATDFAAELVRAAVGVAKNGSFSGWTNSFVERGDQAVGAAGLLSGAVADKVVGATGTQTTTATATTGGTNAGVIATYRGIDLVTAIDRFQLLYSRDEGSTWEVAPFAVAAGIGQVRGAVSAYNALWFATDYALYKLGADETITPLGDKFIDIGIEKVDDFEVPYAGANGLWLAPMQGGIMVTAGGSVLRYTVGAEGQVVWPAEQWLTAGGHVQALVAGEGGIYFGAGGRLWNFDGRGFHSLAQEPNGEGGGFDYLHYHKGRVYYSPAAAPGYFNLGFATQRPDLDPDSVNWFTTGYQVSSQVDFGKVSAKKVGRYFETRALFYGSGNTGKLQLHYLVDPPVDPGQIGGGATSLPWVLIGEHSASDGPTKVHTLTTPVVGRRWWFRITSIPTAGQGYPMLMGYLAEGRALLPPLPRIVATLEISTGTEDGDGAALYPTLADQQAAIQMLTDLRNLVGNGWLTVDYVLGPGLSTQYLATVESYSDNLVALQFDNAGTFVAALQLGGLP